MKIRYIIALLFFCCLYCSRFSAKQNIPIDTALQEAMDESIKTSEAIGVSAAVIFPDGKMWKGASGISHEGVPVTTDMLFDIGSIEKNFQAALCLKLAEEGLLSLDDPLDKWFPPYPYIDGKVTLRQILNMTSGFDKIVEDVNSPWRIGYQNIQFKKIWTWEQIHRDFISEPNFTPGTRCDYSTTNYIILKHVIEQVTQRKQIDVFEDRILKPFQLNHTWVRFFDPIPKMMPIAHGWCDIDPDEDAEDITAGYSLNWLASFSPMLVYSTPGDMVRWIDLLYHQKTVLSEDMLSEMLDFFSPVQNEPMMKGYGLGVVDINVGAILPNWDGIRMVGHLGSQFGYSAFAGYFPDLKVSVAILFNRGCDAATNPAIGMVANAFFDALFKHLGLKATEQKGSVSALMKQLEKTPDDVHLMVRIAELQQENNEDYEASLMYERILKQDPEDQYGYKTDALFWKASYDGVIHKKPENLIAFITEYPDYKDIQNAYRWLAKTYKRRNEMDEAVQVYHDALKELDKDAEFYNHYAWWIYENKIEDEYETAIHYAKSAVVLKPEAYYIWDTLAWLYFINGEKQKAVEASEKALSLAPENQVEDYKKVLNRIKNGR